jgi:hypothetical protein
MKHLSHFCALASLLLALAASTFAGQVNCPGSVEPPPASSTAADGHIDCPGRELAVSFLEDLLALL